jgi:hypothetical protein
MTLPVGPQRFLSNNRNLVRGRNADAVGRASRSRTRSSKRRCRASARAAQDHRQLHRAHRRRRTTSRSSTKTRHEADFDAGVQWRRIGDADRHRRDQRHAAGLQDRVPQRRPAGGLPRRSQIEGVSRSSRARRARAATGCTSTSTCPGSPSRRRLQPDRGRRRRDPASDATPLTDRNTTGTRRPSAPDGLIRDVEGKAHRIAFEGDESNVYVRTRNSSTTRGNTSPCRRCSTTIRPARASWTSPARTRSRSSTGDSPPTDGHAVRHRHRLRLPERGEDDVGARRRRRCDRERPQPDRPGRRANSRCARRRARCCRRAKAARRRPASTDITVETDANTELVTAECIAIDFKLDPHAFVGHEAWTLKGSVSGDLGTIYTGEPFAGDTFGLTIPVKTPPTSGNGAGTFSLTDFTRGSRTRRTSKSVSPASWGRMPSTKRSRWFTRTAAGRVRMRRHGGSGTQYAMPRR